MGSILWFPFDVTNGDQVYETKPVDRVGGFAELKTCLDQQVIPSRSCFGFSSSYSGVHPAQTMYC